MPGRLQIEQNKVRNAVAAPAANQYGGLQTHATTPGKHGRWDNGIWSERRCGGLVPARDPLRYATTKSLGGRLAENADYEAKCHFKTVWEESRPAP